MFVYATFVSTTKVSIGRKYGLDTGVVLDLLFKYSSFNPWNCWKRAVLVPNLEMTHFTS